MPRTSEPVNTTAWRTGVPGQGLADRLDAQDFPTRRPRDGRRPVVRVGDGDHGFRRRLGLFDHAHRAAEDRLHIPRRSWAALRIGPGSRGSTSSVTLESIATWPRGQAKGSQ